MSEVVDRRIEGVVISSTGSWYEVATERGTLAQQPLL